MVLVCISLMMSDNEHIFMCLLAATILLSVSVIFFFLKILFIYSQETHRERQRHRKREKQAPQEEPDVGLDPRTLESHPEPKADAPLLSHPDASCKAALIWPLPSLVLL